MAEKRWDDKDPDEELDYNMDWSVNLARINDTIQSSTWFFAPTNVDSALIMGQTMSSATGTRVWLSEGTDGVTYKLINRIVTLGGRRMEAVGLLHVRSK